VIEGFFHDGTSSRRQPARAEIRAPGRVRIELVEPVAPVGSVDPRAASDAAGPIEPRHWERALAEVRVSERLGKVPRRIELPGVGVFETDDNDGVDRALAALGHSSSLVHWLEERWPVAIASLVAIAAGSFLFVRFGLPALAALLARELPTSLDVALGAKVLELFDEVALERSELPESRQAALSETFASMTRDLGDTHAYRLEPRAAPRLGPNALALPSGIVVLTDELVLLAQHDEEIVAVLAHEIGHVRGRHALRQLIQSTGVSALAFALLGDISSASTLLGAVPVLIEAKHSRDFEREADAFARDWLERNGIAPTRFDEILCRMQQASEPGDEERFTRFLATHPTTEQRARCAAEAGTEAEAEKEMGAAAQ
jgi:Zn-dependent protease with chaperone function